MNQEGFAATPKLVGWLGGHQSTVIAVGPTEETKACLAWPGIQALSNLVKSAGTDGR